MRRRNIKEAPQPKILFGMITIHFYHIFPLDGKQKNWQKKKKGGQPNRKNEKQEK